MRINDRPLDGPETAQTQQPVSQPSSADTKERKGLIPGSLLLMPLKVLNMEITFRLVSGGHMSSNKSLRSSAASSALLWHSYIILFIMLMACDVHTYSV